MVAEHRIRTTRSQVRPKYCVLHLHSVTVVITKFKKYDNISDRFRWQIWTG